MNQVIVKGFVAAGPIADKRYVKFGAKDGEVLQAAGPADDIIGVSDIPGGIRTGGKVDVVLSGWTAVEYGGVVARGKLLTSDASGRAVQAAPGAGVNVRTGGLAFYSGVAGDIVDHLVAQGSLQGA